MHKALTYSDLHCQQPLAGIFSVNGELHGQRGGHPCGVEAGSAGSHLTSIMCGQHLHLVGADGENGRRGGLKENRNTE